MGVVAKESMSLHPAAFLIEQLQILPSDACPKLLRNYCIRARTVEMMYSILFRLVTGGKSLLRMGTGSHC
jgi:hypothetical protein